MAQLADQIFQYRSANTSANTAFTKPASKEVIVKHLFFCNQTAAVATFSFYYDKDGSTYDETTIIFDAVSLDAHQTYDKVVFLPLGTSGGTFGVKLDTANAITVTGTGVTTDL